VADQLHLRRFGPSADGEATSAGRPVEPRPADPDHALREAARLEEIAANAHERAAELYESWLKQRGRALSGGLEHRARMHREIAAATRSIECLAERTLRGFEARIEAGTPDSGKQRSLVTLSALGKLRVLLERRIEEGVAVGRRAGATWAEIAAALHVTRQTAHQRYRSG
jgi:hypothetical protein